MDGKYWWQSRTIWLNGSIAVLTALVAAITVLDNAGAEITASVVLLALLAGLNTLLRFTTATAIKRQRDE